MTEYIAHRVNTVDELKKLPQHYGVEIDIRDYKDQLVIVHDPFKNGEDLETYLSNYKHGTLILNVKSERIEHRILELLNQYGIKKYFFLDCSFPMIYQLSSLGEKNIAIRFSEFEGLDTILKMAGKINWVWVDCFTKLPINKDIYNILKKESYKLCLVSPELQGQDKKIEVYKSYLETNEIYFDAICTKSYNIHRW